MHKQVVLNKGVSKDYSAEAQLGSQHSPRATVAWSDTCTETIPHTKKSWSTDVLGYDIY